VYKPSLVAGPFRSKRIIILHRFQASVRQKRFYFSSSLGSVCLVRINKAVHPALFPQFQRCAQRLQQHRNDRRPSAQHL